MSPQVTTNGSAIRQVVPPVPVVPPPTPRELTTEYVSGGAIAAYAALARTLPPAIDDLTTDFGDDLYERMMVDPTIAKCVAIFKAAILEDGIDLNPAITDDADPDYELATLIRDEAEAMLDDLETSLDDVLWDMADHLAFGNVVAEQRYQLQRGHVDNRQLLQLIALKPKPRRTYAFVVDAYMNVVGLLAALPGQSAVVGQTTVDPATTPNILPREKFAVATFRPRKSDPRGTSILRPAYDPWWRKRQMLPEWLKFLTQFGSPSIWGTTPEKAQTEPPLDSYGNPELDGSGTLSPPYTPTADVPVLTDPLEERPPQLTGTYTMTPEQRLAAAIMEFRGGTALAVPYGTELHALEMQGKGEAFIYAKGDMDRDIVGAILTQTLATEEGQHQARAAAEVHQDVLATLVHQAKRGIVRMLTRDVLRQWVRYNWGDRAAHLVPSVSLGHTSPQDQAAFIVSLAQAGYQLHASQFPELDEIANLPVRDLTQDDATTASAERTLEPPNQPAEEDKNQG
jgi:hypothetical protein